MGLLTSRSGNTDNSSAQRHISTARNTSMSTRTCRVGPPAETSLLALSSRFSAPKSASADLMILILSLTRHRGEPSNAEADDARAARPRFISADADARMMFLARNIEVFRCGRTSESAKRAENARIKSPKSEGRVCRKKGLAPHREEYACSVRKRKP